MQSGPLGNPVEDTADTSRGEQQRLVGGVGDALSVKQATVEVRIAFVRKVYGILSCQLAVTFAVAFAVWTAGQDWLQWHEWLLWVSIALCFVTLLSMICCQNLLQTYPANYVMLFVFTSSEAVMIGFVSASFSWQSLLLAAGVTAGLFMCLTLYAFITQEDFSGLGPYLMAALLALTLFAIVAPILAAFGASISFLTLTNNVLGVILFSFFVIFDTQMMLGEWGGHRLTFTIDEYCFAALNLYMDMINLFLHILSLLGERRH